MTRISQHNFPALQQYRMIVGRVTGESRFYRQRPKRRAGVVESRALDESKARVSGRESTQQGNKPGSEKCNAHRRPFRKGPAADDVAPKKGKNKKVAPDHELKVVPFPWGGFEKVPRGEDNNCRQDKGDVRWRSVTPTPARFPNTPSDQADEGQRKRNPQAEVC